MKLTILLFAGLAEKIGSSRIEWHTEDARERMTVGELKLALCARFPAAADSVHASFAAVNRSYAADEAEVTEADELALIPPVSGGEPTPEEVEAQRFEDRFRLTYEPLSVEEVCRQVSDPKYGAVLAFVGSTREYTHGKRTILLEYEAYEPMALETLRQIGREISARWTGAVCAISHRLGSVPAGEISVVIAVASPHRDECYDASRYAIERLKVIVPIWKKEVWEDGSEWKGHQTGPWNPMGMG
ncbi:molybdenum cofactor biosynthesis protein [Paenibacillus koleovorans]|uniref:molybdenum cofactor biosynthesis protein n=1 Tax=Paenibacillus koleovorans TaxID=121608 RepID=UPI000FDA01BD|nr:molybdenum cofactor biosynthesis protein MoaE [Paenibacillus koleovorans]